MNYICLKTVFIRNIILGYLENIFANILNIINVLKSFNYFESYISLANEYIRYYRIVIYNIRGIIFKNI